MRNTSDLCEGNKIYISDIMFYLCYFFLFGIRAWGGQDGTWYYRYTLLAAIFFFVLKIAMTKHTGAELLCMAVLLGTSGITWILTGEKGLLLNYMMMLGMKEISERKVCRAGVGILAPAMFLLTFLTTMGLMEERVFFIPEGDRHSWALIRHSLGYPHTNTLLTTYVILMMFVMYLTGNRDRMLVIRRSAILMLAAVYYWLYCDSRTGLVIAVFYLAVNYYCCFHLRYRRLERVVIYGLYPLICMVIIGGAVLSPESPPSDARWYSVWDRFRLTKYYMQEYPISLFGVRITIPENELFGLDISQMHLLLNMGVVAFCLVSFLYWLLLKDCVKNHRSGQLAIILCLMVLGISDPLLYNLSCKNLTFLFMGAAFYRFMECMKNRMPSWLRREVCLLSVGSTELSIFPRLFARGEYTVMYFLEAAGGHFICRLTAIAAAGMAMAGHVLGGYQGIESLWDRYSLGVREFALRTLSIGVYVFLIVYIVIGLYLMNRQEKLKMRKDDEKRR